MRRAFYLLLTCFLLLAVIPVAQAATVSFSDVPANHWAYTEITAMAEKGIIQGYGDGKFYPNNFITRAEFAKIMIAAAGVQMIPNYQLVQTFQDVPRDHWAFGYIEYAKPYLTGYKSGNTLLYKPNENAVREDIAVALVRLKGYSTAQANLGYLNRFIDQNQISPLLKPFIAVAIEKDLIRGFEDNTFRPQNAITRAEAAVLLYRAKLEQETKIVLPDKKVEDLPLNVTDSFSGKLTKWQTDKATATWFIKDNRVSAYNKDSDVDHYFLPLIWKESAKPANYQIKVDVIPKNTNGLAGLFFNGEGGKADVVVIGKDFVSVRKVSDPRKHETTEQSRINYKLQSTNKLKVVVKGNSYEIYVNDKFLFAEQNVEIKGTSLGLYMMREAFTDANKSATYLDNFEFKVLD